MGTGGDLAVEKLLYFCRKPQIREKMRYKCRNLYVSYILYITYMYLIFYTYGLVNELMKVLIDLISYVYLSKLAERN